MLGISHETKLSEEVWQSLPSRAELPFARDEFLNSENVQQSVIECKRLHSRKPVRTIAIAMFKEERHACYAKDVSRMGVGFYSPINLLPKTIVTLWLPSGKTIRISITRCRRLGKACFECGGTFQLSPEIPRPYLTRS